ncbi:hypothetical protein [Geoalkalibacter halelectricus]|uniref:Uncharacterized protein n=1 Tax=Geoalkalibacter halelectricus TaxID=2847045 RepID=A0ABY5ZMG4_9BACT|nr:hypothetical protein [Geoalkalibacter halelectricus]MDO3378355.1 hypothetical protein [Geoalkalibacter halelectricus]UWZ80325.1 hypothetical protein L9S41_02720 [Geoalkalibacter halelectricus]
MSLANGLPIWYEDETGLKLAQCLDQNILISEEVGTVNPCNIGVTFPQFPPSLTNLSRLSYWEATAAFNYLSTPDPETGAEQGGFALLVLRLAGEGAGIGALVEGNQAVSSRIRLRIDVPVPGTYRVTHPFGTVDYVIDDPGRRSINQTQDVGKLAGDVQNFLVAMNNRVDFQLPGPDDLFSPDEDEGPFGAIVNQDGRTIGPFLVPTLEFNTDDFLGGPVEAANGDLYIGLPFAPLVPGTPPVGIFQPVTPGPEIELLDGGLEEVAYFRIELLNPPENFFLNAADETQILETNLFQVVGKIFNGDPNVPPAAPEVTVGLLKGRSVVDIDVFAGVDLDALDPLGDDNVHGVDPMAIALADPIEGVYRRAETNMPLLTQPRTLNEGSIRRITRLASGQSLFRYLPSTAAAGIDTFHYVVQDTGGLMSAPAAVNVVIEDLQVERADFRVRTGKWHISGTTDQTMADDDTPNTLTIMAGPHARLSGTGDTAMTGQVALSAGPQSIDYRLTLDGISPPPQDNITAVNLHVDGPGQPVIFRLCGNPFIFPNPPRCEVIDGRLDIRGDLNAFDDLLFAGALGVLDLDGAIDAIFAGNTYVSVVNSGNPDAQVRGNLETPVIAENVKTTGGVWGIQGKPLFSPGFLPNVTVRSAIGAQTYSIPVVLR